MYPPISIIMTTYFRDEQRKQVAEDTLRSWVEYLDYDGMVFLHVADDGSTIEWEPEKIWTVWDRHITRSRQGRKGVGASLNAGFREAYKTSPLILYAVDDWKLTEPLDITPWCKALLENDDIGIMRLGPPHPFLRGSVEIVTTDWQGWALKLDCTGLVVAQRPALWHKRMTDYYGWFKEEVSAIECEKEYSERLTNSLRGPNVYLALPHKWQHIESESLSEMGPGE